MSIGIEITPFLKDLLKTLRKNKRISGSLINESVKEALNNYQFNKHLPVLNTSFGPSYISQVETGRIRNIPSSKFVLLLRAYLTNENKPFAVSLYEWMKDVCKDMGAESFYREAWISNIMENGDIFDIPLDFINYIKNFPLKDKENLYIPSDDWFDYLSNDYGEVTLFSFEYDDRPVTTEILLEIVNIFEAKSVASYCDFELMLDFLRWCDEIRDFDIEDDLKNFTDLLRKFDIEDYYSLLVSNIKDNDQHQIRLDAKDDIDVLLIDIMSILQKANKICSETQQFIYLITKFKENLNNDPISTLVLAAKDFNFFPPTPQGLMKKAQLVCEIDELIKSAL